MLAFLLAPGLLTGDRADYDARSVPDVYVIPVGTWPEEDLEAIAAALQEELGRELDVVMGIPPNRRVLLIESAEQLWIQVAWVPQRLSWPSPSSPGAEAYLPRASRAEGARAEGRIPPRPRWGRNSSSRLEEQDQRGG